MEDHVIIINSHIDNKAKEDILIDCIKQLKKTGIDIMVSSHTRISPEVLDLVDYYVFDKDNPMIKDVTDFYFYSNPQIEIQIKTPLSAHSYTALKNVKNAVYLSKSLGKKYFYHIEYDCIISDTDVDTLINLPKENKGYLGYLDVYNLSPSYKGISMLFYYSEVDSFLNITQIPSNVEEYTEYTNKHIGGIASEMYLYNRFQDYLGAYKQGERNKDVAISLLNSDKLSLSDNTNPNKDFTQQSAILWNKNNKEEFYFVVVNDNVSKIPHKYDLKINDQTEEISVSHMCLFSKGIKPTDKITLSIHKPDSKEVVFESYAQNWIDNLVSSECIEFK